jgi:phosphatidylinositol phospholipase C, delta
MCVPCPCFLNILQICVPFTVDIYDGDSAVGPLVFHGGTLTSSVPVRDICVAIAKYAFVTSPFPVLISAEVHCSVEQQDMMVRIMDEVFGDTLVRAPVEGREQIERLPSPEELKGKVLLKVGSLSHSFFFHAVNLMLQFLLGEEPLCGG